MIQNVTTSFDTYKYLSSAICIVINILLTIIFIYLLHKHNNKQKYKLYICLTIILFVVWFIVTIPTLTDCGVVCYEPEFIEIITIPLILFGFIIALFVTNNSRRLIVSLIPSILLLIYTIFTSTFSTTLIVDFLLIIIRTEFTLLPVYFYKR